MSNIPLQSVADSAGKTAQSFDYIIVGAGCAGLSLAMSILENPALGQKKLLIIDKAPKSGNDRTWCYWQKKGAKHWTDQLIHHQWNQLWCRHPQGNISLDLGNYNYRMIRSREYYQYCFQQINKAPQCQVHFAEVKEIDAVTGRVLTSQGDFSGAYVFSSVLQQPPVLKANQWYLMQHFKGWWIETETDCFDPEQAELMNFNTTQQYGCAFVYTLPVSKRKALVEFTLFNDKLLEENEYKAALQEFIQHQLGISAYWVMEEEYGVIPMTNYPFPTQNDKLFYIGTAGGQTKASTGYTFLNIQKNAVAIARALATIGVPLVAPPSRRFRFYDSVLLRVLQERRLPGADVFYQMFLKNKATTVLRFLDNETHIGEELTIMSRTKKSVFLPAAMKELF